MSDRFSTYDASYLVGALSPADRADYEAHLAGCAECRAGLDQLAGMPGLLSSVTVEQARAIDESPTDVPATLLPRLLAEVQRTRFRRRLTTGLVAAAAALIVAVALIAGLGHGSTGQQLAAPTTHTMTPTSDKVPIAATAKLSPTDWGTRIVVTCIYKDDAPDWGPLTYTMVVTDVDGGRQQISTWKARPGPPIVVDGSTSIPPDKISSIDILGPNDMPVLTLAP